MKKTIFVLIVIALSSTLLFYSCSSTSRSVSRIERDSVVDLSGRWNDTDSRVTAEEMVKDVINRPWISEHLQNFGKKPVIIVGKIRNKSSEHIPIDVFVKDIEKELINSGKISFVASKDEREGVREERADQQEFASEESMKKYYKEMGADYMLGGVINSIEDSYEGQKVILYQINLELINIENNTKVWINNKEIKKFIEQSGYKF